MYSLVSHSVPEYPETHSHTLGKFGSGTRQIPRPLHALAGHTLRSEKKSIELMIDSKSLETEDGLLRQQSCEQSNPVNVTFFEEIRKFRPSPQWLSLRNSTPSQIHRQTPSTFISKDVWIFSGYLSMTLVFTAFQHGIRWRPTAHWKSCEYQCYWII